MSASGVAPKEELLELASKVVSDTRAHGADEVAAYVSEGSHIQLARRDHRVEEASEATTRRLVLSILAEDRYSSHSTSDLRPEALDAFLKRAVAATRHLEPDPARALAPGELCGRGASEEQLDQLDPTWADRTPEQRGDYALSLEEAVLGQRDDRFVSGTVYVADVHSRSSMVMSNGFSDSTEGAWFSLGGTVTLSDADGRRPEGGAYYAARYSTDLPSVDSVATEAFDRAREMVGSGPTDSGRYTLILSNRVAQRILGVLAGPLNGGAIHHGRSCLADKLGQSIGSEAFSLYDDPTIPRGLGSQAWDGDGIVAKPRTVVEKGVLQSFYMDMYYSRKLGREPTTGGPSNWVIPPGDRDWRDIAKEHPKAILVTGFLGGNSNGLTGDFSYGIRGKLIENGEPVKTLSEMNVAGNLLTIFDQLLEVANDPWRFSSVVSPTLFFTDVVFSGT